MFYPVKFQQVAKMFSDVTFFAGREKNLNRLRRTDQYTIVRRAFTWMEYLTRVENSEIIIDSSAAAGMGYR